MGTTGGVDADTLIEEMRLRGIPVSEKEAAQITAGHKLEPILDQGALHRAIAEELFFRGAKKPEQVNMAVRGFSILDVVEQEAIVENIYIRVKELAGAQISFGDTLKLEKLAAEAGMSVDTYIEFVKTARAILLSEPVSAKAAIYLILEGASKKLIADVAEQYKNRSKFGKTYASRAVVDAAAVKANTFPVSVVTGIFKRGVIHVNKNIQDIVKYPWSPKKWERTILHVYGRNPSGEGLGQAVTFDDLRFIIDNVPFQRKVNESSPRSPAYPLSRSKREELLGDVLQHLIGGGYQVVGGALESPLEPLEVQFIIRKFSDETQQRKILAALHYKFPDSSLYLPEMLEKYQKGYF